MNNIHYFEVLLLHQTHWIAKEKATSLLFCGKNDLHKSIERECMTDIESSSKDSRS